jgi:hypothetical protein
MMLLATMTAGGAASAARIPKGPEGNSGNTKIAGEAVSHQTPSGGHTSGEITDWIEANVSSDLAGQIEAGLDPNTGFAKFVELYGEGKLGASDSGTIAVTTYKQPLWLCALVLMHEWSHCTGAHSAAPNNPDSPDPAGKNADEVCGWCHEASMVASDLNTLAQWACDPPILVPPIEACKLAKDLWRGVGVALTNCAYSGPRDEPTALACRQASADPEWPGLWRLQRSSAWDFGRCHLEHR